MNKKFKSLFSSILLVIFLLIAIDLFNSVKKRPQKINDYTRERLASKQKKEQISLLCIVLTSNASIFERGEAVWDTWAKKCTKTLFACNCQIESRRKNLTEDNSRLLNKIEFSNLAINESYDLMSEKVLLVVKLAYENYAKNYNWFLLVDDDTYIFYDNLIKFIETKNSKWPFTYGYNFKTVVESGYHSGMNQDTM